MALAQPPPTPPPVPPPVQQTFALRGASIKPAHALFAGAPVRIGLRFSASGPLDLQVRIRRPRGKVVRRFTVRGADPRRVLRLRWNGLSDRGYEVGDGRYRVTVGPVGRRHRRAGKVLIRGHVFPAAARHGTRGSVGDFGVPRSGGRVHEGYDILAACGSPVRAARGGKVTLRRYDPALYGNYLIVHGSHERRDYWYAHLRSPGRVKVGGRVRTGQRIGDVGETGNARGIACQLHFELRGPGGPFNPLPSLRTWDLYS